MSVRTVSGFPYLAEVKMVRGSGASSSNSFPGWDMDLDLPPREEVEVTVDWGGEPDMDVYGERDPARIRAIVEAQLKERVAQSQDRRGPWRTGPGRNAPPGIVSLGFLFPHAQRFDPENLEKKQKSFSRGW